MFTLIGIVCSFALGYLVRESWESHVQPGNNARNTSRWVQGGRIDRKKVEDIGVLNEAVVPKTASELLAAMPSRRADKINMAVKSRKTATKRVKKGKVN